MSTSVLAQIAALKCTPVAGLKARWRELFGTEPPPYNRKPLASSERFFCRQRPAPSG
jgi:hypothetical protein